MRTTNEDMKPQIITTTLGELITAISEAAREATVSEQELSKVTHQIVNDLLRRRKD